MMGELKFHTRIANQVNSNQNHDTSTKLCKEVTPKIQNERSLGH